MVHKILLRLVRILLDSFQDLLENLILVTDLWARDFIFLENYDSLFKIGQNALILIEQLHVMIYLEYLHHHLFFNVYDLLKPRVVKIKAYDCASHFGHVRGYAVLFE